MGTGFSKLHFNIVSSDFFMFICAWAIMVSRSVKGKEYKFVDHKNSGNLGFLI